MLSDQIILKAYKAITRVKGADYAPTAEEIQKWADRNRYNMEATQSKVQIMKFHRYDWIICSTTSGDIPGVSYVKLVLTELNLFRETPKGYWIGHGNPDSLHSDKKWWVSKTAKKRYAYPTKEQALTNLIKRNEKRIRIYEHKSRMCSDAIHLANRLLEKLKDEQKASI